MKHKIQIEQLSGRVIVPPSKSLSHRAILAAALSKGHSIIENVIYSDDVIATLEAVMAMGVNVMKRGSQVHIISEGILKTPTAPIECRESGSTLRFLMPFVTLVKEPLVFTGAGKLLERPLKPYFDLFDEHEIRYSLDKSCGLVVDGKLVPGTFHLPGNVSSQFITGLLFVLPLLQGDSQICLEGTLESADYVHMSIAVLNTFGIAVTFENEQCIRIKGGQRYQACTYQVESDYSQSAFWIVAGILNRSEQTIQLSALKPNSIQGDSRILAIAKAMGGRLNWQDNHLLVSASKTKGTTIDASQCPDLIPVVATLAAVSQGRTEIINASRVRLKESDRLKAIATELNKIGAQVEEQSDGLIIHGVECLTGGMVNGWQDHRIVMSLAIAALKSTTPIDIEGSEAVRKSYPHFFEDLKLLGGIIHAQ